MLARLGSVPMVSLGLALLGCLDLSVDESASVLVPQATDDVVNLDPKHDPDSTFCFSYRALDNSF